MLELLVKLPSSMPLRAPELECRKRVSAQCPLSVLLFLAACCLIRWASFLPASDAHVGFLVGRGEWAAIQQRTAPQAP